MRHSLLKLSLALTLPVLFNCSGSGDGDDTVIVPDGGFIIPDSGIRDGGPRDSGVIVRRDAGPRDAGVVMDNNDTIAEATPAMVNQQTAIRAVLNPAGDRDFYSLTLTMGQYLIVTTNTVDNGGTRTDPVVRLYNSAEAQVAENDDGFPRASVDSEVIYRIPEDGTYYIEVLEWSDWSPMSTGAEGGPLYSYELRLLTLSDRNPGVNVDLETGDDVASALALEFTATNAALIAGTFNDNTDVDYFTSTFATGGQLSIERMPAGTTGYGSTTTGGTLIVTNVDSSSVAASLDLRTIGDAVGMPLTPGNYTISIDHAGDAAGANDFYFLKAFVTVENPPAPPEPNDTAATAGVLPMEDNGAGVRQAFILTNLTAGDVDYFSFDVLTGELPSVACGSETSGSGVRGLLIELLDSAEMQVAMAMETPPDLAFIPQTMTPPGSYFVRLSKTGQAAGVDADFVRCGIRSGPMN